MDRNFRDLIGIASHAGGNVVFGQIQYVLITMFFQSSGLVIFHFFAIESCGIQNLAFRLHGKLFFKIIVKCLSWDISIFL